jgi:Dolichyl-phosphate-mannose-protein mannosyltransferase
MSISYAFPKAERKRQVRSVKSIQGGPMFADRSRRWDGLLCGCFVMLVILCSFPFAEMGFIDDWSYIKTAQEYARTGHFIYNGWATAMLGWQVPWGALFIKLFGFSFSAPRISTLLTSLLAIWLFCSILERFGIERRNAIFGSLMLGLSPLFAPLSASFMTDISGLFIILLCIYMCMRALAAASDRAAFCWLGAAALTNVAGGTVRQIAWLGTLVLVPSTAWLMRRRPRGLVIGLVIWAVGAAGVFGWMRWWQHQPYSVPEKIFDSSSWMGASMLLKIGTRLLQAFLCLSLLLFPLLAAWFKQTKIFKPRAWAAIASFTGMSVAMAVVFGFRRGSFEAVLMPWLVDVVAALGTSPANLWMLGSRPVLGLWMRAAISLVVLVTVTVFLVYLLIDRDTPRGMSQVAPATSWQTTLILFGPFALAYITLLLPRILRTVLLDRYFLGLMPIAILCLLKLYQDRVGKQLPIVSYALLAAFSIYTVAGTHDWFALQRARIRAGSELVAAGVPVTHIQGGSEYDGWTQINHAGPINTANIDLPNDSGLPKACYAPFGQDTPAITPEYFVVLEHLPCLATSRFGTVNYRAWLPPFQRAIYIQQRQ